METGERRNSRCTMVASSEHLKVSLEQYPQGFDPVGSWAMLRLLVQGPPFEVLWSNRKDTTIG